MSDDTKTTVQCSPAAKELLVAAAKAQRFTMPELMDLLVEGLAAVVGNEPSVEERKEQMRARLNPSATAVRSKSNRSVTALSPESHNGLALAAGES